MIDLKIIPFDNNGKQAYKWLITMNGKQKECGIAASSVKAQRYGDLRKEYWQGYYDATYGIKPTRSINSNYNSGYNQGYIDSQPPKESKDVSTKD